MLRRLFVLLLICLANFAWEAPTAEAGWRNGRQTRVFRSRSYTRQKQSRTRYTRSSSSQNKPHMTQSRSAVLDGFFNASSGPGHDRSWYVGK